MAAIAPSSSAAPAACLLANASGPSAASSAGRACAINRASFGCRGRPERSLASDAPSSSAAVAPSPRRQSRCTFKTEAVIGSELM